MGSNPTADICRTPASECARRLAQPTPSGRTVWPSGLRRWLQAPVRKGVGSNPTAVISFFNGSKNGFVYMGNEHWPDIWLNYFLELVVKPLFSLISAGEFSSVDISIKFQFILAKPGLLEHNAMTIIIRDALHVVWES